MTAEKPQPDQRKRPRKGGHRPAKPPKIDKRTSAWRQVEQWKAELSAEIGEPTARQSALIEAAARQRWILEQIDSFLMASGSVMNRRDRKLFEATKEREAVLATLLRILDRLAPPDSKSDPLAQWLQQQRKDNDE